MSKKNKNNENLIIRKEEINDYVDSFYSNKIGDIYYILK